MTDGISLRRAWRRLSRLLRRAPLSTEDRVKLVRYVYDRGVRYFDTTGNYMESQSILGEALNGIRDHVYLVTKVETTCPERGWRVKCPYLLR